MKNSIGSLSCLRPREGQLLLHHLLYIRITQDEVTTHSVRDAGDTDRKEHEWATQARNRSTLRTVSLLVLETRHTLSSVSHARHFDIFLVSLRLYQQHQTVLFFASSPWQQHPSSLICNLLLLLKGREGSENRTTTKRRGRLIVILTSLLRCRPPMGGPQVAMTTTVSSKTSIITNM